nr:immunoglobulin heavy chain junction region [Mus musculus]
CAREPIYYDRYFDVW